MGVYVPDEELLKVVEAAKNYPTNQAAADSLGMARKTFTDRIKQAVRRNLLGHALGGEVPEGFELTKITTLTKQEGGRVMEWRHVNRAKEAAEDLAKAIAERLNELVTPVVAPAPDITYMDRSLTLYNVVDFHLGQYSWGKEAGGQSYDLDIARDVLLATTAKLTAQTPPSDTAVIVYLGDNFHADGPENRTPKSGNALDVDSRYTKVVTMGSELAATLIDNALLKHRHVIFKALPGNHDPHGGDILTLSMWMRYKDDPRVTVDRTPGLFWFFEWGKVMLAFHHGHETKPESMPGVMAAYEPGMWGRTVFRYAYLGHFHRKRKGIDALADERGGAIWEVFQAITAKDAWNRGAGHASGRSMTAITFDKDKGEVIRNIEPIGV